MTGFDIIKSITNIMAVVTIGYSFMSIVATAAEKGLARKHFFLVCAVLSTLFLHILLNHDRTNYIDLLKYFSLYLFAIIGIGLSWERFYLSTRLTVVLVLFPLIVEFLGGSKVYSNVSSFGFFPNNNTAVMYYSILAAIILTQGEKYTKYSLTFIVIALSFQKLGAILSATLAMLIVYRYYIYRNIYLVLITALLGLIIAINIGLLDRIFDVFLGLLTLFQYASLPDISDMSYQEIISITNTNDLSSVFRIKHWIEILNFYSSQSAGEILFGYGARYTMVFTTEGLMPHSDILRIVCELGLISFFLFIYLNFLLFKQASSEHFKLVLLMVLIYFFSENLLDNFVSMYLLYLLVGMKSNENHYGK